MNNSSPLPRFAVSPLSERFVAGCMTGTSLDGLDAVLLAIRGQGLGMTARIVNTRSAPLGPVAAPLRLLAEQVPLKAGDIAAAARDFALLHTDVLRELLAGQRADLVVIHGQTVFHAPPVSWQLFNPTPVAVALNVPVVTDLRAADLALGGQGAPITPLADFILYRDGQQSRAVVNLGGFCNITQLPACAETGAPALAAACGKISGGDVCACNQLLDKLSRELFGKPYDEDGRKAAAGRAPPAAFEDLVGALERQWREGRSLGTGDELGGWLRRHAQAAPEDLARCACAAIAQTVVRACAGAQMLILAGGGARNQTLCAEIRQRAGVPVISSDELGIPINFREAAAMAVLGALCLDRVPITLPQVTGVKTAPLSGVWVFP